MLRILAIEEENNDCSVVNVAHCQPRYHMVNGKTRWQDFFL